MGIPVNAVLVSTYVLTGLFAGIDSPVARCSLRADGACGRFRL